MKTITAKFNVAEIANYGNGGGSKVVLFPEVGAGDDTGLKGNIEIQLKANSPFEFGVYNVTFSKEGAVPRNLTALEIQAEYKRIWEEPIRGSQPRPFFTEEKNYKLKKKNKCLKSKLDNAIDMAQGLGMEVDNLKAELANNNRIRKAQANTINVYLLKYGPLSDSTYTVEFTPKDMEQVDAHSPKAPTKKKRHDLDEEVDD